MKENRHTALLGYAFIILSCLPSLPAAERAAEKGVVRIVFGGDIMLDGGPGHFVAHGGDPLAGVAAILRRADISVANLECVIATAGRRVDKDYSFLGKPNSIPILKRHFTAIAVANNHACDYGPEGLLSQLKLFDDEKLPYFGGGRTANEARRPLVFSRNGRRIALLNYCGAESPEIAAGPHKPGVAWLVKADVLADIRAARAVHHADIVIPFLHWGLQGDAAPTDAQRTLARELIDAGADAVVGSHPHVTQTVDFYRGRPIVYSLGNLVFDYFPKDPAVWSGWLVELTFGRPAGVEMKTYGVELDSAGVPHLVPVVSSK